jgi:ubiquinone biosynthesis monooxygenase Coq7
MRGRIEMSKSVHHSFIDRALIGFDQALRTVTPGASQGLRQSPAAATAENEMSDAARKHAAGLMRINHTGEVCAQALYQGQAATAKLPDVRESMEEAAAEEVDHLTWCEQRLTQLDSRPSLFNPLWYGLSYGIGAAAGLAGDRWSLGFVAETEQQVCEHLRDTRSRAILEQMIIDEEQHGKAALDAGGTPLPAPAKWAMTAVSQVMKKTTYRL